MFWKAAKFGQLEHAINVRETTNVAPSNTSEWGIEVRYDIVTVDRILADLHAVRRRLRLAIHGCRWTAVECAINACDGELSADDTSPVSDNIQGGKRVVFGHRRSDVNLVFGSYMPWE